MKTIEKQLVKEKNKFLIKVQEYFIAVEYTILNKNCLINEGVFGEITHTNKIINY